MKKVDLSTFPHNYSPKKSFLYVFMWYVVRTIFFTNYFFPINWLKIKLLKAFGARIGKNVIIKPNVYIKYPWFLTIDDNSWIGEFVVIDNLDYVTIGKNVVISQGAYILTASHNYKKSTFPTYTKPVNLEDGTWIGAKAIVGPGVRCHSHSVLTLGSVATKDLEAYYIYAGNPASKIRTRIIED